MRSTTPVALAASVAAALAVSIAVPAEASSTPAKISNVQAVAGPEVGEVTITFDSTNANTTGYRVKTGLTSFTKSTSGRNAHTFTFSGHRNSITLSADDMTEAGAGPLTGNHLYFRLAALNGSTVRAYPRITVARPEPVSPKRSGTALRMASFNVRTARVTNDGHQWLTRAVDVANEIADEAPGIVSLQELGPGRADGKVGSLNGTMRQTDSLESALASVGASRYRLVRTTPYNAPGTSHGTQGARILYDTKKYELLTDCPETTGKKNWNGSCSFDLPIADGDGAADRRSAAYAEFADKSTGQRFFVASTHMDDTHSANKATEKKYNALRPGGDRR